MSKSFPTPSKTFFILFFLHLFLSLVLRLTGQLEQRIFNEILIYGALAYSMIGSQWNYDPSYLKTSSVLFLLYLLSIFSYPYANYCQTILSLTYALSEKNQYNHIPLEEAYSIIDLAKAAGYDTYWISNQAGFSASDTPITIISSTAAHHTWINGRGASPSDSTYLDGKLITELPDNVDRPSFIVIHLMGSHSRYADRYPKSYSLFSGRGKFVDGYDNSVRYVDSVLQGIFEKVHNYSNFQGFLYLPDHGEDPESGNAHSPDKFTFQMVRIPFLVYLSPKAIVNRPEIQKELQKHKDLPWTNDLAYNLLISLLGIQNAPYEERQFDLASPTYQLNWEKVKTQHGTKSLSEKIDPHSRFK